MILNITFSRVTHVKYLPLHNLCLFVRGNGRPGDRSFPTARGCNYFFGADFPFPFLNGNLMLRRRQFYGQEKLM